MQNLNPSFSYLLLGKVQCQDISMVTKTHLFCLLYLLKIHVRSDSVREGRYKRIHILEIDLYAGMKGDLCSLNFNT